MVMPAFPLLKPALVRCLVPILKRYGPVCFRIQWGLRPPPQVLLMGKSLCVLSPETWSSYMRWGDAQGTGEFYIYFIHSSTSFYQDFSLAAPNSRLLAPTLSSLQCFRFHPQCLLWMFAQLYSNMLEMSTPLSPGKESFPEKSWTSWVVRFWGY